MKEPVRPLRPARHDRICGPITYHNGLNDPFWARYIGLTTGHLRKATEAAIRTRHHQAIIDHPCHMAQGRQPNIYRLDLGVVKAVWFHYTIERHAVVVRGYHWDNMTYPHAHNQDSDILLFCDFS